MPRASCWARTASSLPPAISLISWSIVISSPYWASRGTTQSQGRSAVSDWNQFVLIFQKRHLFAHTLGVADEDYLNKSGDAETPLGKKVKLTKDDVIFFAGEAEKIVQHYFGHFLS